MSRVDGRHRIATRKATEAARAAGASLDANTFAILTNGKVTQHDLEVASLVVDALRGSLKREVGALASELARVEEQLVSAFASRGLLKTQAKELKGQLRARQVI